MMFKPVLHYWGYFRRHRAFVLATLVLTGVFAAVNATTMVSDYAHVGQSIDWRKPVLYELSSAVGIMVFLPLIIWYGEHWPLEKATFFRRLPHYIVGTVLFSAGHVLVMVLVRKLMFPILFDQTYEFFPAGYGPIPYEYWKDVRTFVLLFGGYCILKDALAAHAEKVRAGQIELRSGATRILIDPAEFLYAKGAANYAEIVCLSGESLARVTLADLEQTLVAAGVAAVRVHRSHIVNRAMVQKIDPVAGGDLLLSLKGGHMLRASRRYKAALG